MTDAVFYEEARIRSPRSQHAGPIRGDVTLRLVIFD